MKDTSAMTTEMVFSAYLTKTKSTSFAKATLYYYFVGSHQYFTINLLELNYDMCCEFGQNHTNENKDVWSKGSGNQ